MTDIVEFLKARINEDEAAATVDSPRRWSLGREQGVDEDSVWDADGPNGGWIARVGYRDDAVHIARHDPARVLAEVAAKRQIVNECAAILAMSSDWRTVEVSDETEAILAEHVMRALAQPYADHPDFDPQWRSGLYPTVGEP